MAKAMLIDLNRCIGCRACQAACKQWNDLPAETTQNNGSYENPPNRSAKTWTTVAFHEISQPTAEPGGEDGFAWVFSKQQCMHCLEPACASACIVGAMHKSEEGPVVYDDKKCMSCRYCMMACPYGVPAFEWDTAVPYIRKCTMCADRIALGMEPACAKACPTNAIQFGEREALIVEGRKRIRASPAKYVDHIYGEKEVGGASMLYLSSIPFSELDFPKLGDEPIDRYAAVAMLSVPPAIVGVSAIMAGTYWIIQRREKMMQQTAAETGDSAEKEA